MWSGLVIIGLIWPGGVWYGLVGSYWVLWDLIKFWSGIVWHYRASRSHGTQAKEMFTVLGGEASLEMRPSLTQSLR